LENPSQPEGSWLSRLVTGAAAFVVIALILLAIMFAIYQYNVKIGSSRSVLAPSKVHAAIQAPYSSSSSSSLAYREETVKLGENKPVITSVHFPEEIRADGTKISGKVHFQDPDADVNYVKFEVIAGRFTPFAFEPKVQGTTSGSFGFLIYCNTPQRVTLKVTLFDRGGHFSSPFYFSFRCVIP